MTVFKDSKFLREVAPFDYSDWTFSSIANTTFCYGRFSLFYSATSEISCSCRDS
jgi:hypothetical protein